MNDVQRWYERWLGFHTLAEQVLNGAPWDQSIVYDVWNAAKNYGPPADIVILEGAARLIKLHHGIDIPNSPPWMP